MGMFCKHSPNLVFGLGHRSVQLHPVLLLKENPLPGTDILLLWQSCCASFPSFPWKTASLDWPLHCTSCGCRISLPNHPYGRFCSSPHSMSLACHPMGRPHRSSHPVDLLPIHLCGRCRRSSHPRGRTCFSSQPLALTAGSRLLSLVSHPLGRLDKSFQPSYPIFLSSF